jgi:hypothetical protein
MKSSQKFHNYDRKGLGCQYKNPFLSRINRQKMFLDKAFFTLNFKWKALKIALKNVTAPEPLKCLALLQRLSIKDLVGKLGSANRRFSMQACFCLPQARMVRFHQLPKIA